MTFPIGCSVSFCLKTLPLNTSLFGETVFEKSQVFNLSRFKIGNCVWWRFCSGSNIWDNRMSFCSVLVWNQLWLSFGVNMEISLFPGKVNLKESSISYSKMNTLLFSVFLLFVLTVKCILCRKWKVRLSGRRRTICGSFKINTTTWVLHSKCMNVCVLFISTMICFAFFWWQEWQVQDSGTVLGHFQHCSVMRLSCLDELVNN